MSGWDTGHGVIALPDGRTVRGRPLGRHDAQVADLTLVLLGRPPADDIVPGELRWVRWRDFRAPWSTEGALEALREAYARAATHRVEVACRGGVGRTGTALAALAVLGGVPAEDAVDWIRSRYHPRAVETPWQRRWVRGLPAGRA
ncbi:protein-tyrosine phosphatase family protein [Mumia sp. DW29H23]|uniref:protein-tyrosine phosphatase family protein n=1 Tax=Mumia sp. DW29H23 TaxID=3421241 RepID=UPI003D69975E